MALLWRHRFVILALWILGIGAGVAFALTRPVTTTAEVRMAVGSQSLAAQSVPGYVASLPTITSTYARYVRTSTQDLHALAQRAGLPAGSLDVVRASPIPDSAILRIEVVGATAADTVKAANEVAGELKKAVQDPGDSIAEANAQLTAASRKLAVAETAQSKAKASVDRLTAAHAKNGSLTKAEDALTSTTSDVSVAQAEQQAAASRYQNLYVNGGNMGVRVVRTAAVTGTNRNSMLQQYAIVGFAVATVLAGLLVFAREQSRSSRRARNSG